MQKSRPATVVQEDGAPSHKHRFQAGVFEAAAIPRLHWCGNSPDLNAIEACWPYMKRSTTKKGAPTVRAEAVRRWEKCWQDLPQHQIQAWIERIPYHIQEVLQVGGDNNYQEGRNHLRRVEH